MNAAARYTSQSKDLGLLDLRRPTLDSRITFTRASQKTYFDRDLVMKTAANDVWPVEFDPATGRCLGRSVWPARTNIALRSQEFNLAPWAITRATLTAGAITAPDGTMTGAHLVEDNTVSNTHTASQSINYVAGTTYAFSVFAKAGARSQVRVVMNANAFGGTPHGAIFDTTDGSVVSTTGTTIARAFYCGNGWWRLVSIATATVTVAATIVYQMSNGGTPTYTGDGVSGIYLWGAQMEAGWYESPYIVTAGASATRAVDVATVASLASLPWNAAAGTMLFRGTNRYEDDDLNATAAWAFYQSSTQFWLARLDNIGARTGQVFILYRGDTQYQVEGDNTDYGPGMTRMRHAAAFENAGSVLRLAVDGDLESSFSGTFPTVPPVPTELRIGRGVNTTTSVFGGWIESLLYLPRRVSDAELTEMSS